MSDEEHSSNGEGNGRTATTMRIAIAMKTVMTCAVIYGCK